MKNLVVIVVTLIIAALFATQVPGLDIDLSLSQRFVGQEKGFETYADFIETFGPEPALAVLVHMREGSVWDEGAHDRIRNVSDELSHVPGIERVISIGSVPGLDVDPELMRRLPLVRKLMMGTQDDTTLILLKPTSDALSPDEGRVLVHEVGDVVDRHAHPTWQLEVTGPLWLQSEAIDYSRDDLKIVTAIALVAMILILGVAFRSARSTIGPILVATITVVITLGIIAMVGITLSQFALLAVPILVGLAILDGVHIVHAYNCSQHGQHGKSGKQGRLHGRSRFAGVLDKEFSPCVWTSITTLIGFIVLVSSPIAQVKSIGLVIAIGVPISFMLSFTLLPSLLLLGRGAGRRFMMRDPFSRWATPLASFIERRSRGIVVGFIIAALIVSTGIALLHVRLDFPRIFRKGTAAEKMLTTMEDSYAGAGSIEVVLEARHPHGFLDPQTLQYAANFQQGLSLSSNVVQTISFLDAGVSALMARHVDLKGMRLGDERMQSAIDQLRGDANGRMLFASWITDDFKKARIHTKLTTRRPERFELLDRALKKANARYGDWFTVTPTGFGYLYKAMEKVMLKSFLSTFAYALIGIVIALIIIALRRSSGQARGFRRGLASISANLLPIGIVLGLMGWLGEGISVGIIILPAVGLGLLADDTIHFMMALRRAGGGGRAAVEQALRETGWPVVMTQLILLAAFGSLVASHFTSNVTLGIFMSLLLIIGLAFDLLFVPALVMWGSEKNLRRQQ